MIDAMNDDREPLDEPQCLRLLAGMSVGRVVYTVGALPAVLPVRFRLDDDGSVLLRASARPELSRAVDGAVIAFEAGEVSGVDGGGWSVTVLGTARVVDGQAWQLGRPSAALSGYRPEPDEVFIRVRPELIRGHILEAVPAAPA